MATTFLNSFSKFCPQKSAQKPSKNGRTCDGVVKEDSRYDDKDGNHCVTISASCGFTVTAILARSDGFKDEGVEVGSAAVQKCSQNKNYSFRLKSWSDRKVD